MVFIQGTVKLVYSWKWGSAKWCIWWRYQFSATNLIFQLTARIIYTYHIILNGFSPMLRVIVIVLVAMADYGSVFPHKCNYYPIIFNCKSKNFKMPFHTVYYSGWSNNSQTMWRLTHFSWNRMDQIVWDLNLILKFQTKSNSLMSTLLSWSLMVWSIHLNFQRPEQFFWDVSLMTLRFDLIVILIEVLLLFNWWF